MTALTEGFVQFRDYRTAYRILHDYPRDGDKVPLLMVHGGPGYPWWKPTEDELRLMSSGDRPLVFYDQLGCGRSDRPADPLLWTVESFLDELATVRNELGLDTVHLLGWSWGGMLVLEYLLTKPHGVQSVVLASALHSVPAYVREARRLASKLPQPVQDTMRRFEEDYHPPKHKPALQKGASPAPTARQMARKASSLRWVTRTLSNPVAQHLADAASRVPLLRSTAYRVADLAFDNAYVCCLHPWPEQLLEMIAGGNEQLCETMWGPGETFAPGSLRAGTSPSD